MPCGKAWCVARETGTAGHTQNPARGCPRSALDPTQHVVAKDQHGCDRRWGNVNDRRAPAAFVFRIDAAGAVPEFVQYTSLLISATTIETFWPLASSATVHSVPVLFARRTKACEAQNITPVESSTARPQGSDCPVATSSTAKPLNLERRRIAPSFAPNPNAPVHISVGHRDSESPSLA